MKIRNIRMRMRNRLFCGAGTAVLFSVLLALGAIQASAKEIAGEDLFRDNLIPSIHLILSPEAMSSFGPDGRQRRYVKCTVREGTKSYTNVAIRLKGGPGSFRPIQDKPAFTLNFEKFAPGQRFHGLKKIHLNNSVQDRTYQHERIARELFDAAGVPVPRAGNAWVNLNDRELGMYVLLEGVNKQFLKRYFKDVSGNLYDGHSGSEVTQNMRMNSGDTREWERLHDLARATQEPDVEKRYNALQKTLDLERFYTFVATELILGHWDGYTMNRNNWRIYHDKDSDRMVFIPHGMDQVLGRRYRIFPENSQALVVRSVFEIPEARKRYRERFAEIATNIFNIDVMVARAQEVGAKIQAALEQHKSTNRYSAAGVCGQIQRQGAYVQSLIHPVEPVRFDSARPMLLTNWVPQTYSGQPELKLIRDSEGRQLLHIAAQSRSSATWRMTCELPPGQYRFEARLKTKGVVYSPQDPKDGAGLRISGYKKGQKNAGDRDWTPVHFDFQVPEGQDQVELICELRAEEGEVWYDLASLKLIQQ
jgi:spore coat protein H